MSFCKCNIILFGIFVIYLCDKKYKYFMKIMIIGNRKKNNKKVKICFENAVFVAFCIIYIIVSVTGSFAIYTHTENVVSPRKQTVCIDAGHGGIDVK